MKKLLLIFALFPLLMTSCIKEDTYYVENYPDVVTVYEGKFINDSGASFTVKENNTHVTSFTEKQRYYMVCDILDRDLNIRLKEIDPLLALAPLPATPDEQLPQDPVIFKGNRLTPYTLDLIFDIYKAKGSTYEHKILCRYEKGKDNILRITLYHDGNNEHLGTMTADLLETEHRFYTIDIRDFACDGLTLTYNVLVKNAKGEYEIETHTASSY